MKNPIFEANPSLDCYFETTDGSCFFTENAAQGHAKSLKDKTVKAVHKVNDTSNSEVVKQIEVEAEEVDPNATTEPVAEPEKVEPKVEPVVAKPNTKK